MSTLLSVTLKAARRSWEIQPEDRRPPLGQVIEATHRDFIAQYGQHRWDIEVIQDGGGFQALPISESAAVIQRLFQRLIAKGLL